MSKKQYPFKAWVLTTGFAPKEVELVEATYYSDYHKTAARKLYCVRDLFKSKREAIEAGWRKLEEQMEALKKREATIVKKKAMLTKHSTDL